MIGYNITTPFGSYHNILEPFNYTCFPAGTRIRARRRKPDGEYEEIDLEIEKIKIGDEVLSFNENTEKLEWKRVIETFKRQKDKLLELKFNDGASIKVTEEHPF